MAGYWYGYQEARYGIIKAGGHKIGILSIQAIHKLAEYDLKSIIILITCRIT